MRSTICGIEIYTIWVGVLCLVALVAFGCSGGATKESSQPVVVVQGRLTKGGQPLLVDKAQYGDYARVVVRFIRTDATASYEATVDETGFFNISGADGRGIPPGEYKIAVYQWDPAPEVDKLQGAFDDTNTKIIRQVTGGAPIEIDLDNP